MKCPKCKDTDLLYLPGGVHTFKHKGKRYNDSWETSYYCYWCNRSYTKEELDHEKIKHKL